jgi:putative membrane protein insertion efficiency factor
VSPLRKSLAIVLLGLIALLCTTIGPPAKQPAVRLAVWGIHGYQRVLSPLVRRFVTCRYIPSCSEYSARAIQANGFWRGSSLSIRRIRSCTKHVPMGTVDWPPVPARTPAVRG